MSTLLICQNKLLAQTYADSKYYLVDSLELDKLSEDDKVILDSSLSKYHNVTQDSLKLKYINDIIELTWDEKVWTRYNRWMNRYLVKKLSGIEIENIEMSAKNRLLFSYLGATVNNKAIIAHEKGNYVDAMNHYLECIEIQEQIKDSVLLPEAYNNLGSLYHDVRNYKKAEYFYKKSLNLSKKYNNYRCVAMSLTNLGQILSDRKELDSALVFLDKSLRARELSKETYGIAITYDLFGEVYYRKKEYNKALEYFNKSLLLERSHNDYKGAAISLVYIGNAYVKLKKFNKAKKAGKEALVISEREDALESLIKATKLLRDVYQGQNNWEEAFKHEQYYTKLRDSIQNNKIEESIIIKQTTFDLEQKEKEIELLSAKNELQKLTLKNNKIILCLAILGIILVSIIALFTKRVLNKNKDASRLLMQQNEEKQVMMKEIHHRVKNNLQVVNSLLRLQSKEVKDEKVIEMFKDTQRRVLSMAKLHENMYSTENLRLINVKNHLSELVSDIVSSYGLEKEINVELNIVDEEFSIKTLLPLSLIVNEVITNTLKHAFVSRDKGRIVLELKKITNEDFVMIIGDNGIGFQPLIKSSGLGTKLIEIFSRQLNGGIKLLEKEGAFYELKFKVENEI
ncbi:MAG: tetratricopeptide repeat-containing sensor histidine kinase [Flavobacteriaceae bacterium]